jgi:RimJ/RimL family protein N-acetyltransferase
MDGSPLRNDSILLEPADETNVQTLIDWTLDPVAQGPYKRVPNMTVGEQRELFLHALDRWYYLIRRAADDKPLGRFYCRAWHFHPDRDTVDWELNIFLADPAQRGKGYGTAVQALALKRLLSLPHTHSVFAYTAAANRAEQRALVKAGLVYAGCLPSAYYWVPLPPEPCVVYVRRREE